ncbi:MAG: DUF2207 domain-containing protein [Actinomycetales bacterium]|nr:DUF2207 domain-containing protein [Actinomycetales bacterium]
MAVLRVLTRTVASTLLGVMSTGVLPLPATAAVVAGAPPSAAEPGAEQVRRYEVQLVVRRDASMSVQETITYDFGTATGRHGIVRDIPVSHPYDAERRRVYPVDNVEVSSPNGAPVDLDRRERGGMLRLVIGDPEREVTGVRTYVISYDVRGVVNTFADHDELYWNAVGPEWTVPISGATVTVEGPAPIRRASCFRGIQGSTEECGRSVDDTGAAGFATSLIGSGSGMTVVAAFPPRTFPGAGPILEDVWSLSEAFSVTSTTVAASLAVLVLLVGGAVVLVSSRGRDERYLATVPGLEPAPGRARLVGCVPLFRRDPVAVQFHPPEGLRPGQLGTLLDERAHVVDVTATILDLAVRGHLRIEESDDPAGRGGRDWRLVRTRTEGSDDELLPYETALVDALFDDGDEVSLSSLRQHFREDLVRVQKLLYQDVTGHGWFRGDPSSVRTGWQLRGGLVVLLGGAATVALARWTSFGLVGLAAVLSGIVLLVLASWMPARTAAGTAVLAQARGFRLYLETAEAEQLRQEEAGDVFSRYLPYAVIFGVARRWVGVFAGLAASGAAVPVPAWYVGTLHPGHGGLDDGAGLDRFASSLDAFSTSTSGSIAAATPSSSGTSGFGGGGFSGGGAGGGGGGSW